MTTGIDNTNRSGDEQSLAKLLQLAGERPEIPLGIESRIYHRVREEWAASTAKPDGNKIYADVHRTWRRSTWRGRLLRWAIPVGVVATVLLAVTLVTRPVEAPRTRVATVADVIAPAPNNDYQAGSAVYEGDLLTTGPGGGVSLLLARNASLRIGENSRLRVAGENRFKLLGGRVYADTGQFIYRDGGLKIETAFGVVTDVGTQFAVTLGGDSLDIAVREGRVELAGSDKVFAARMGERLTLVEGQGASIAELGTHDPYWNWIVGLTPSFDLGNKSLLDFLKWAARETGRELFFVTDGSRMFAMRTDINGSITGLTPDEALEAVLSTTTLVYAVEPDRIIVEKPASP